MAERTKDLFAFALRSFGHSDAEFNRGPFATSNMQLMAVRCHISLEESFSIPRETVALGYIAARSRLCFWYQLIMYSCVRMKLLGRELVPWNSFWNLSSAVGTPRILSAE